MLFVTFTLVFSFLQSSEILFAETRLDWRELPDLPNELGVAGPFVGVHNDALIVAGGANFPRPYWENDKVWHDRIHVLVGQDGEYEWKEGGSLAQPIAYGAAVSTPQGVICMGGNDGGAVFSDVFALRWDQQQEQITRVAYPALPQPCAYGQATLIGSTVYFAGGQSGSGLDSAMKNLWALDLSKSKNPDELVWLELPAWPGPNRAFNLTTHQHNGYEECVYVISGRRQQGERIEFLTDVWEYSPRTENWRERADVPRCVNAGTAIGYGQSHIYVLGGRRWIALFQSGRTETGPSRISD